MLHTHTLSNADDPKQHLPLAVIRYPAVRPVVDVKQIFVGDSVDGRIQFVNASEKTLTVERLKSSCGCTAAYVRDKVLKPNESTDLFVRIRPTKAEKLSVGLLMETSEGEYTIGIHGKAVAPLSLKQHRFKVDKNASTASVDVVVNHPAIKRDSLRMLIGKQSLKPIVKANQLSFDVPVKLKSGRQSFNVVLRSGRADLGAFALEFEQRGLVRLISTDVYGTSEDYSFRVIAVGDVAALKPTVGVLTVDGNEYPVAVTVLKTSNKNAVLTCTVRGESFSDQQGVLVVGDFSFDLNLYQK